MTKYILTDETIQVDGKTLHRIELTEDCKWGTKGTKGGFIESTSNLRDDAWVYEDAKVFGNARVFGNAAVYEDAKVFGNARVFGNALVFGDAKVYENAYVYGNAKLYSDAKVYGNAKVYENACVYGNAWVFGNARLFDNVEVYGYAKIYGDCCVSGYALVSGHANIERTSHYMTISSLGRLNRTITITFSDKMISAGCFRGTLEEFKTAVDKKYNGQGNYYPTINFITELFK